MVGPLLRSFGSRSPGGEDSTAARGLLGCLEFVGPTLITGWALRSHQPIRGVILLAGSHRLSQASLSEVRPDVAHAHGGDGRAGFALAIDENLPLVVFAGRPAVMAIDEQDRTIGALLLARDPLLSERRLRAALDPRNRGLRGHWDGIDPQSGDLLGWAHRGRRGAAAVWLQRANAAPERVECNLSRADILDNGQARACGFRIPWSLPSLEGSPPPQLSLDPEGWLPLPSAG